MSYPLQHLNLQITFLMLPLAHSKCANISCLSVFPGCPSLYLAGPPHLLQTVIALC